MRAERLKMYGTDAALDRGDERQVDLARSAEPGTDLGPGGPPERLLWCRVQSDAPADPPDERYYADEVRPTAADEQGCLQWELVPGGLTQVVVHNVAEAAQHSHRVLAETIIRVEERLDRGTPPAMVYLAEVPVAPEQEKTEQLARIVSYGQGSYTVQPVQRTSTGFEDDGPALEGVPNLGELWDDEAGYLAGPEQFDRYVRIFQAPAGWTIVLHPPRML